MDLGLKNAKGRVAGWRAVPEEMGKDGIEGSEEGLALGTNVLFDHLFLLLSPVDPGRVVDFFPVCSAFYLLGWNGDF